MSNNRSRTGSRKDCEWKLRAEPDSNEESGEIVRSHTYWPASDGRNGDIEYYAENGDRLTTALYGRYGLDF